MAFSRPRFHDGTPQRLLGSLGLAGERKIDVFFGGTSLGWGRYPQCLPQKDTGATPKRGGKTEGSRWSREPRPRAGCPCRAGRERAGGSASPIRRALLQVEGPARWPAPTSRAHRASELAQATPSNLGGNGPGSSSQCLEPPCRPAPRDVVIIEPGSARALMYINAR